MSFVKLISQARQVLASRAFLLVFVSLLVISLSIAYVASESRPQERFLSISTLGSNMMAESYYPKGNASINVGDNVNWYLNVYNRMGSVEYVSVRVKLLNSTQTAPDDISHTPSPEKSLFEVRHMLMNNSTWVIPFSWEITQIDKEQDYLVIKSLNANGTDLDDLNVRSLNGEDFRIIIELWRYDTQSGDFAFEWSSGLDKRSAWNQLWFNVKQST